jgi:ABC-2 type transport system permease protein
VLAFMFTLPLTLIIFSTLEIFATVIGIFGLLLFALAFIALGIAISAMTKNQIVAGVISLVVFLILFVINAPAKKFGHPIQEILDYISPSKHLESLVRGVISSVDVVYFASLIVLGLFLACRILDARRWR